MSRSDYPVTWRLLCLKDGVVLKYRYNGDTEDEFVMTNDDALELGASLLGAAQNRLKASGTIGAVATVEEPKKPCEGFRWIGQPFSFCDRCGLPYWEHAHEERLKRDAALPFGRNIFELVPITPEAAAACKAKWAPK